MNNIYLPHLVRIEDIYEEAPDVRSFRLVFKDPAVRDSFDFKAGQFGLYSAFGLGESTFCIASPPTRKGYIKCTFRKTGRVTGGLAQLSIGDTMGFRGPYGNFFPVDEWKGKNIIFIAGGIGLPPVRSVIWNVKVGFVPTVLEEAAPSATNSVAVTCGPPIMIKFVLSTLLKLGFSDESVYTTLENKMKCGVGKCGRCNVGDECSRTTTSNPRTGIRPKGRSGTGAACIFSGSARCPTRC